MGMPELLMYQRPALT